MNHAKKLLVLAAALVGMIGIAGASWAYWTTGGSGSAASSVADLHAPTDVSATQPTVGLGTVRVAWTAPVGPDGSPVSSFSVQRFTGSTSTPACGGVISATSCDDTGLEAGTYTYTVTALFRSWTDASTASAPVTVVLDTTAPSVSSINRAGASRTNAGSVSWNVTFSENVTQVDLGDFTLVQGAGLSGASITGITGSGSGYTVTAATGTGDGTLRLDLVDDDTIVDQAGNGLGGTGVGNGNFTAGDVYSIDKTAPAVISISRVGPSPTNASSVSWTVTFSETVTGAESSDFTLAASGISGASITSAGGLSFTVIANTGSGNGTIGLNLVDNDSIVDEAGNNLGGMGAGNANFAGEAYLIDKTTPTVTINQAAGQTDPTNSGTIDFTVVFSESVAGFDATDIALTGTAGLGGATKTVTGGPSTFNVQVSGVTGNGTTIATVAAGRAQDAATNSNAASTSTDNTVTLDTTAPTVTVTKAAAQADPARTLPINFTVTFSEPVTGFTTSGLTVGGSSNGSKSASITGSGTTYNVAVGGATSSGSVTVLVNAAAAQDAAGNTNLISTVASVAYDITPPTVMNVTLANGGTAGRADAGDTVTIEFSEQMDAAKFCANWTNDGTAQTMGDGNTKVQITNTGSADTLTVTSPGANKTCGNGAANSFQLGTVNLNANYVSGDVSFGGTAVSTIRWDPVAWTLSITLGSGTGQNTGIAGSTPSYAPNATLADRAGNLVATAAVNGTTSNF